MGFLKKTREEFNQMVDNEVRREEVRDRAKRVKQIREEQQQTQSTDGRRGKRR